MKPRTKVKLKRAWNYFGAFVLASACFFASYLAFESRNTDIESLEFVEGNVLSAGVGSSSTNVSGKFKLTKPTYLITLKTSDQIFGIYRPNGDYSSLTKQIVSGQFIRVYFKPQYDKNKPNLQTYRIESNEKMIMDSNDYRDREGIAGWIGLGGGILLIGLSFYYDRKYWKK
jgi:hypothetical protein